MRRSTEPLPPDVAASLASLHPSTRRAYASAWRGFERWARANGHTATVEPGASAGIVTPALASYFAAAARRVSKATLRAWRSGIEVALRGRGIAVEADEPLRESIAAARVTSAPVRPVTFDEMRGMVAAIPADTVVGRRDRAILFLGYWAALSAEELVALDARDVRGADTDAGGTVRVGGAEVPVGRNTVAAVRDWMAAAGVREGPLFRRVSRGGHVGSKALTAQVVGLIVRRMLAAIHADPKGAGGGSLRTGFALRARETNMPVERVVRTMRLRSAQTVGKWLLPPGV